MSAVHLKVLGRVQGVGFRWFIRTQARKLGLSGWVMNLPDGSVEIAAEGEPEKLDELRRYAAQGPPGAEVMEVVDLNETAVGPEFPFALRKRP